MTEPAVVAQLGGYLADTGRVAEAIRLLEPLARDAGADAETLNALGIAYIRAGRRDDARADVRARAGHQSRQQRAARESRRAGARARRSRRRARALLRARRRAPIRARRARTAGSASSRCGRAIARRRSTRGRAPCSSTPRNFDAVYNAGTTLARDGQTDAARPYLELFLKTAPPAFYAKDLKEVEALLRR